MLCDEIKSWCDEVKKDVITSVEAPTDPDMVC